MLQALVHKPAACAHVPELSRITILNSVPLYMSVTTSIWDIIYMLCLNVTNIILTIISLNHPNTFDYGK